MVAATPGFEHSGHGIASELLVLDCTERLRQVCLPEVQECERPAAHALGNVFRRMGAGRQPRRLTHMHVHTSRDAATGALTRTTATTKTFPIRSAFLHVLGGADSITGDRTEFVGRNGNGGSTGRDAAYRACREPPAPASIPAAQCRKKSNSLPGRRPRSSFCWAGPTAVRRPTLIAPFATRSSKVHDAIEQTHRLLAGHADNHRSPDAQPRVRFVGQSLAAVPDAELPRLGAVGVLSVGRCVWLSRSTAGRDGARLQPAAASRGR